MLSTVGGIAALVAGGGILLRRRVSRDWISRSSVVRDDRPRLARDRTIIITGGNAGLGYAAALDLASLGGRIVLACRDVDAGERAASRIRESTGNDSVDCARLDLSSLDSVWSFADEMTARGEEVFALVCNAGVWVPDGDGGSRTRTEDGYEVHFGVNHLGHFALIRSLLPRMERSGIDGRIIIVSSSLCKAGKIDLIGRDFIYDGRVPDEGAKKSFAPAGYCDSKLMNMLTCRELAVRLRGSNISTYAVSPGFCRSQLGRNVRMPLYKKALVAPIMRILQRSAQQGALNIVHAVVEEKGALASGVMYQDGKIWQDGVELVETLGDDLQKELWEISEELIMEKKRIV